MCGLCVEDSRNTLLTATIYRRDLMIPWEVCQWCNESNESLFVCECVCVCVSEPTKTKCQGEIFRERNCNSEFCQLRWE